MRAALLALLLACSEHAPPPKPVTIEKPAKIDPPATPHHSSHDHEHGPHPHPRSDHHHHPHPHPHLAGLHGHHHPY